MKRPFIYIVICFTTLFLAACEDLERDNPLDGNNNSENNSETDIGPNIEFSRYTIYENNNNDEQINKGEPLKKIYKLYN